MPRDWLGSGAISMRETAERIITETIRRVKLAAKNDGAFVPPANALSTILASRMLAVPPAANVPTPRELNAVMAARIFLRGAIPGGNSGNQLLTFGTHLTGGSYDGSAPVTLATDATPLSTANTIVSRGASKEIAVGDVTIGNGQFYKGTRNTGSAVINLLGFVTGTDTTKQVIGGATWIWTDTADVTQITFTGAGAATFVGIVTAPSFTGALTGNASTATALQTGRTINGVTFDGTANITITAVAAAGTLTGATLAAGVTASSLTSLGTLAALVLGSGVLLDVDSVGGDAVAGQCTLVAGTVTVNTTMADSFANGRLIFFQRVAAGGTIGFASTYTTVAGTSFTLTSDNPLDLSTYNWFIIKVH